MSFAKAQTGVGISATTGTTLIPVLAANPVAGHLLVLSILFFDGTSTPPTYTIADGNGNNFTQESHNSGSTNMTTAGYVAQAYLIAPANANKTITVTFNKAIAGAGAAWVNDFAPSVGTPTYDQGAFANGTGTINTPTIPVAASAELVSFMASDAIDSGAVTGSWVEHDAGRFFGCGSAHILSVSANTAVGRAGSASQVFNAIGMSFSEVVSSIVVGTGRTRTYWVN